MKPIEEVDQEIADLFHDIVHKKYIHGIEKLYIGKDHIRFKPVTPPVISQSVKRNDPCPECLKMGKKLKWKKCKEHNKDA